MRSFASNVFPADLRLQIMLIKAAILISCWMAVKVSSETTSCRSSDNVTTVCVGLSLAASPLELSHQLPVNLVKTQLCILHGANNAIPAKSFISLPHLEGLFLNITNVRAIEPEAFEGLPKLKTLGFFGNKIASIQKSVFVGCGRLETMDLSGNDIELVGNINWSGLENLKNLLLVHNFIRTMSTNNDTMGALQNLEYFDLSLNYLESLQSSAFKLFKNLVKLNLSYNRINHIEHDAFNGLIKLKELNLSGNFLKQINMRKIAADLQNLVKIELGDNQFQCKTIKKFMSIKLLLNITVNVEENYCE